MHLQIPAITKRSIRYKFYIIPKLTVILLGIVFAIGFLTNATAEFSLQDRAAIPAHVLKSVISEGFVIITSMVEHAPLIGGTLSGFVDRCSEPLFDA